MIVRAARPEDADWMGRVHVEAWRETYAGLLPSEALEGLDPAARSAFWRDQIARGRSRIAVVADAGFAAAGPQREEPLRRDGWAWELYAIYLLRRAQGRGLGRALFRAVQPGAAFTCCVVVGNDPACRFYGAMGGRILLTRDDAIAGVPIREHVFAWGKADAAQRPQV
jgi:GNAT superfamily N-acetyltransferase